MTESLLVDPRAIDRSVIARAAAIVLRGGTVAFPTETVYGLGALADSHDAIAAIYAAKGRPAHNPLIAHVLGVDGAKALVREWTPRAETLARAFWPGPLTLVLKRAASVPAILCAGGDAVAVRAPVHPVARALIEAVGRPIAAPSANRSNALSPTTAEHVHKGLDGRIDAVLDGGPCAVGIESTVIDLTSENPVVLRPGGVSIEALSRVLGVAVSLRSEAIEHGVERASPGMDRKHYAPRAKLSVVERAELQRVVDSSERPVGVLTLDESFAASDGVMVRSLGSDAEGYARELFAALHAMDDAGASSVVVERVPEGSDWDGVRDRLSRASADSR